MASEFAIIYSPAFLEHDTGPFHPENPGRLQAIVQALQGVPWADALEWRQPTPGAEREVLPQVLALHAPQYVEALNQLARKGGGYVDGDTPVSSRSYEVALLAVSAWLDGVDYGLATGHSAFALARPPGHHAIRSRGMGFCLLSNAAIAAHYALRQPGVERVAILDWDVHHGNGTQALIEDHPQLCYGSIHQSPAYPGTGAAEEGGAHGNVLNVPMPPGSAGADYQVQFETKLIPFLKAFGPDLLIVSAGYDANQADPLASMALQPEDFGLFTTACAQVCDRIVFGLEGGYDHAALSQSVLATIAARLQLD